MADAVVLKDFLVSLGWKVDDTGMKQALGAISNITKALGELGKTDQGTVKAAKALDEFGKKITDLNKNVQAGNDKSQKSFASFAGEITRFGAAAAATITTISLLVQKQTQMFENLFFLSQRTGSAVSNLLDFGSAANQLGVGVNAARGAIDSLTQTMKLNPGIQGVWRGLGIDPNQDPTKLINQLAYRLRSEAPMIQKMWADTLGVPWNVIQAAILPGGVERQEAAQNRQGEARRTVGLSDDRAQKLTDDALRFGGKLELLGFTLGRIADVSYMYFLPTMEKIVDVAQEVVEWFGKWNDASGGWLATLIGVFGAFKTLNFVLGVLGVTSGTTGGLIKGLGGSAFKLGLQFGALYLAVTTAIKLWESGLGGKSFNAEENTKKGGVLEVGEGWRKEKPGITSGGGFRETGVGQFFKMLGFAEGGIVPINAHAGEIVLPQSLSRMLLTAANAFQGGGSTSGGAQFTNEAAKSSTDKLLSWLGGILVPKVHVENLEDAGGGGGTGGGLLGWFNKVMGNTPGTAAPGGPGGAGTGKDGAGGGGGGDKPGGGAETGKPGEGGPGTIDRSKFEEELKNNPALREKVLRIAANEQSTNKQGTQAVIESMMNRAQMRGRSLAEEAKWTGEGGYYAQGTMGRGALEDPKHKAILEESLKNALAGGNVSQYATDNASGNRARQVTESGAFIPASTFGGETFFTPGSAYGAKGRQQYAAWRAGLGPGDKEPVGSGGAFKARAGLGNVDKRLIETVRAAAGQLGEGYRVIATSGERPGSGGSQHQHGNALDVQIVGPQGAIPNRGADTTGMYAKLAHAWYNQLVQKYPGLIQQGKGAWGGEFGTQLGGGGPADLMHFDLGNRRGRGRRNNWAFVDASMQAQNNYYINSPDPKAAADEVTKIHGKQHATHLRNMRRAV